MSKTYEQAVYELALAEIKEKLKELEARAAVRPLREIVITLKGLEELEREIDEFDRDIDRISFR